MCTIWPSSSSSQTNVYIEKYTFTDYDTTSYGVVQGTKDYATFYLDYVFNDTISANYGVIRRVNADNSAVWMTAFNLSPVMKSLSVDPNEQYVYIASWSSPIDIVRMNAVTGVIVDLITQQH